MNIFVKCIIKFIIIYNFTSRPIASLGILTEPGFFFFSLYVTHK